MKKLALQVNQRAVAHPEVEHWISPYLEHDFKDANVITKACTVSLSACPTCKCINEPMSGTRNTPYPLELHNTTNKAFSISGDGASMFDGDNVRSDNNNFEHRLAGSDATYAWFNEMNGRVTGDKVFTPINKRTCWPTSDLMSQAQKIMISEDAPIPNAPPQCKQIVRINGKAGEINKTNAEMYAPCPNPDKRGNKQLFILRKAGNRGSKLKIRNSSGKEVGCAAYYGTYSSPGLHRWYVGSCSGQTPWGLYKALGNEWGFAELGGGKCLLFNSIRREGVYR
jgi:hypothetical protein